MKVLVTGGLGYIGSHTVVALTESGYEVIIADNLYNSSIDVLGFLKKITGAKYKFYQIDVSNARELEKIFKENKIDAVIHFAGYKAVGESVKLPLMYYKNNLLSTIELAKACVEHKVGNFIFSSSATVYGDNEVPYREDMKLMPSTNPYGETKTICERILTDTAKANDWFNVVLLRYFNPIGAHKSGLIGEKPNGIPNNLIPYVTQVACKKLDYLRVFGNDYPTPDGTGVRDYIHVDDLARGHVLALNKIKHGINIYNLGTGIGYSVLDIVKAFEKVNGIDIPYKVVARRDGDLPEYYANAAKALKELGFKTEKTLEDMLKDSWHFEKTTMENKKG